MTFSPAYSLLSGLGHACKDGQSKMPKGLKEALLFPGTDYFLNLLL